MKNLWRVQLQGKQYVSIWPSNLATGKLELPMQRLALEAVAPAQDQ
jgi:hypothetical protein